MTMTEVMVAFLLLTIIFAMLYHCIRFSSNMMMRAADLDREMADYEKAVADRFAKSATNTKPYALASRAPLTVTFRDESAEQGTGSYSISVACGRETVSFHPDGDQEAETREICVYVSGRDPAP